MNLLENPQEKLKIQFDINGMKLVKDKGFYDHIQVLRLSDSYEFSSFLREEDNDSTSPKSFFNQK